MLANRTLQAAANTSFYQIQRSLRFRASVNAYLTKLVTSTGLKAWTFSVWVKRGSVTTGVMQDMFSTASDVNNYFSIGFMTDDTIRVVGVSGGSATVDEKTTAKFRDPSAWYHVVVAMDTAQATGANRLFIYVNGVSQVYSGTTPVLNADTLGPWMTRDIGRSPLVTNYFEGYMSEIYFIEGFQLNATSFGQTDPVSGVWSAKRYLGVYGNNGFYFDFNDNSSVEALGYDKQTASRTFSTSGTYNFTVPAYSTNIVVKLWGGGGGGGGGGSTFGNSGTAGTASTFLTLSAGGGGGGTGAWTANPTGVSGAGGTATGGTINTNGNSIGTSNGATYGAGAPNGGGNVAAFSNAEHYNGTAPGGGGTGGRWAGSGNPTGGGGGSGAYVEKTYVVGDLNPGAVIPLTVGVRGSGGSSDADQGAFGAAGRVMVIVDRIFLTDVSSVAGWTVNTGTGGTPSITLTSGDTRVANGSNNSAGYYKTISTVIGQTYYVEGRIFNISIGGSSRAASIIKADVSTFNVNAVTIGSVLQSSGSGTVRGTFVATATTTYISIAADILISGSADFEDVSVGAVGFMNNWTPTNISLTTGTTYDSMLDVPLGGGGNERGNYCTWNPLSPAADATLSNANLTVAYGSSSTIGMTVGTIGQSSGKWYYEFICTATTVYTNPAYVFGVVRDNFVQANYPGQNSSGWGYTPNTGDKYHNAVSGAYGTTSVVNDIHMCAYDIDAGKIWWGKNGTWFASGDPATGANAAYTNLAGNTIFPAIGDGGGASTFTGSVNFGQRPFSYTPPTGYSPLHTGNFPIPTIRKSNQYFDTTLYTGNGSSQSVTNSASMQPDLIWLKNRSGAENHQLFDSVRGANKALYSNLNNQEGTDPGVSAFNTNGFTLGGVTSNANTASYVAWQWKKGVTPGFDIVTYTGNGVAGRIIPHNLGAVPKLIITKPTNSPGFDWMIYHATTTAGGYLLLNQISAYTSSSVPWNNTAPTSTVFSVGSGGSTNPNGVAVLAYLFAEVAGFSKIGGYIGNGSTDGPFIYCGFRPKFVLIKRSETTSNWYIHDSVRDTYNYTIKSLFPDSSAAENGSELESTYGIDFVSNGFKIRSSHSTRNTASGSYIFIAFAEAPFKSALAR